ncbi:hypothetical protein SI65_00391 [Aspergillus cristatus]|uniref:HAD superfamily hydrolase n=1 Tax=Aspergillus cristatus TaxID=573508 RepID=A0A1E3BPB5_ASPCR|nr:hypothetical protein SI65_00391 [Aspergillus cristatus]
MDFLLHIQRQPNTILTTSMRLLPSPPFQSILRFNSLSRTISTKVMSSPSIPIPSYPLRQRRFAPLKPERKSESDAPALEGIVFDVDGTLCLPQHHMFSEMRSALGIDKSIDILHHIRDLPTPEARLAAADKIKAIEREAMSSQQPQPGLVQLMDYLQARGTHIPAHEKDFLPIITRETPDLLPKPDPAGILHIAQAWKVGARAEHLIMVGDSIDDMTAGHMAGAATVLLLNEKNGWLKDHEHTDLSINRLDGLVDILENGFVGHRGGDKPATSDREG